MFYYSKKPAVRDEDTGINLESFLFVCFTFQTNQTLVVENMFAGIFVQHVLVFSFQNRQAEAVDRNSRC